MTRRIYTYACTCVLVITMGAGFVTTARGSRARARARAPVQVEPALVARSEDRAFQLWGEAVRANQVAAWLAGVQQAAEEARAAAAEEAWAAAAAAAQTPAPTTHVVRRDAAPARAPSAPRSASGGCGGATNGADHVIQAESGGNANALNSSGAWGCYQIKPGTWAGHGCAGAWGSASPAEQAACASKLSPSDWAATW